MKKFNSKKLLMSVLTVSMVMQNAAMIPTVYAAEIENEVKTEIETEIEKEIETESEIEKQTPVTKSFDDKITDVNDTVVVDEVASVEVQDGVAVIPATATVEEVKAILAKALVVNSEAVDAETLEWEYYGVGKTNVGQTKSNWGSVEGFSFTESGLFGMKTTYTVPAIQNADDGDYQIRLKGTETSVTLTKTAKLSSVIECAEAVEIVVPYDQEAKIDYALLYQKIWDEVVVTTTPELTLEDVSMTYQTLPTTAIGSMGKDWIALEGGKKGLYTYPALEAGVHTIKISYAGNDTYGKVDQEVEVTFKGREDSSIELLENGSVSLIYNDDMTIDYATLEAEIWENIVVSTMPEITFDDVTMTYYSEAKTGSLGNIGKAWVPLSGATVNALVYPAISEGEQTIRVSFEGNPSYNGCVAETTITVKDREASIFNLNDGPFEIGMIFTEDGYDYAATADAIYDAVVESTTPELDPSEVVLEYDASLTNLIKNYQPLDTKEATAKKFAVGTWTIRLSWSGNKTYKPMSVEVPVTMTDNRIASSIVGKEGATFTYNVDAAVMKQAILDQVIDYEQSELPAVDTLTVDDFEMSYYATSKLTDNVDGAKGWAPIEGGKGLLGVGTYPVMGAGEQKVRISYKGSVDYRPSEEIEITVNVQKANVSVKVATKSIFADETPDSDFITTNPADQFDVYTIYAGVTSSVSTGVFVDFPTRYTENNILKLLDPIVEKIAGKTFTQMLQDGVTVGELRQLFSTQELLDVLKLLNIDTGVFGQILEVINKLPGVADNIRIGFGTPNRSGVYTVTAVTDSPNYNTGIGSGLLIVKMHTTGSKLNWNQSIPGKMTVEQAQAFDFGATLTYRGEATKDQSSVQYLYTGLTSSWRLYSSTTPPTQPGRYVVTVATVGGNYLAAPATRSFQIVK